MNNKAMFIVTCYGCNSTPSDLWPPTSKLFTNYDKAYSYFLKVSPSLTDENNKAEQDIYCEYDEETDDMTDDYIMIENRVQIAGFHSGYEGMLTCAKRPEGAVIGRILLKN